MKLLPRIGLRGKLSIIIVLSVLAFAAVLTFFTSRHLADVVEENHVREAASLATFLEANLETMSGDGVPANHLDTEIQALVRQNPDRKRISVYAPVPGKGLRVVASSDRDIIGTPAGEPDMEALQTNNALVIRDKESIPGDLPEASYVDEAGTEWEYVAPLHNADGVPVAAAGIHMDMAAHDSIIRNQQIEFAILTNLGLLSLLVILYLSLNRMIIRPVKKLTKATRHIGQPGWNPSGNMNRRDEIGDLDNAFYEVAMSLRNREEEVRLLLDASVALSSALYVEKIMQILCEKIASSKKVTFCRISVLDDSKKALEIKAAWPSRSLTDWDRGIGHRIELSQAPQHARVLKSSEPLVMRRKEQPDSLDNEWEWALTPETESSLLLPLQSKEGAIGVITLGEERHWERMPFSAEKIGFYQTLVNHAAVAIDNAKLYEKTEWQVRELSAMHNMSQAFTSSLDYQEVVSVVAERVGKLIGAQFASVLLPDNNSRYLNIVAGYNLSQEYIWTINKKRRISIGFGPIGRAFVSRKPCAVTNVLSDPDYGLWKHIAGVQGYSSLIALPLLSKGESLGVICIYFMEPRQLRDDEVDLLITSANEAAIAIANARIYENLQDAFVGTIRSLAETIDAKDTYTRGHSERVSLYAEAIARNLGLNGDELETIRYAGYLHDVGKIGIPDSILSKSGKLTIEEFRIITKHPVLSERILKPVNFPFPVQSIVRHHHERFDGKGYPDNLAREEIPLGARILFVADAYEAMTSDRPYRKALSTEKALGELEKNKGTQFDPRVVDTFAKIIMTESSSRKRLTA